DDGEVVAAGPLDAVEGVRIQSVVKGEACHRRIIAIDGQALDGDIGRADGEYGTRGSKGECRGELAAVRDDDGFGAANAVADDVGIRPEDLDRLVDAIVFLVGARLHIDDAGAADQAAVGEQVDRFLDASDRTGLRAIVIDTERTEVALEAVGNQVRVR